MSPRISKDPAIPGQYIVGFAPGTSAIQRARALQSLRPSATEALPSIDGMLVRTRSGKALSSSQIGKLADNPVVRWVQPDYILKSRALSEPASAPIIPNDPQYGGQYSLNNTGQTGGTVDADINLPEAWQTTRGSKDVVVAIADTSIDIDHPDIKSNAWVNRDEVPGNGVDDDKNGKVDDVHGWNFITNSPDVTRGGDSHGTHTTGTIGAVADNGLGVAGVAPGVQVMALPILGAGGATSNAVKAFAYATENGANIISNSWGNNTYEPALAEAVARATKAGVAIVVAAGNENWDTGVNGSYPDNYAGSIAIGASDHNDRPARYSNRGVVTIDAAAPGDQILSTIPGGRYQKLSGTSMAAPHYAGVMALVKSAYPQLTMKQVEERINRSVRKDGNAASWNDRVASGGRIDAAAALTPIATPGAVEVRKAGARRGTEPAVGRQAVVKWKADLTDGQRFDVEASLNATAAAAVEETFEQGAQRAFRSAGDRSWTVSEGLAKSGSKAFRVAGLKGSEQSRLELTETVTEPTELSFWYRGDKRPGQLSFFVNRDLQFQPTAQLGDWQQFTTTLQPGEHTLTWLATGKQGGGGEVVIDDVKIGKVSAAQWKPIGVADAATTVKWTPDATSDAAQVRVRPHNGKFAGDWVVSEPFKVADAPARARRRG